MNAAAPLLTMLLALSASTAALSQTVPTDREIARKHAACVSSYEKFLEVAGTAIDEAARVTVQQLLKTHRQVTFAFGGAESERLLKASKAAMQLVLVAHEGNSDPQAVVKFLDRRMDACVEQLTDLTDEQQARVEKFAKP